MTRLGLLAMLFATTHPELVARLALVSPAPATADGRKEFEHRFAERMKDPAIAKARSDLQQSDLRNTDPPEYKQRAFELSVAGYFRDPLKTHALTPFRLTGRVQQSVWKSLGDYDIRDDLSELEIPSLVIHGRHDEVIPFSHGTTLYHAVQKGKMIAYNAGHNDCPPDWKVFWHDVASFLRENRIIGPDLTE